MTFENAIKVLDAASRLLNVLVWPAVVVFALIRFGAALKEFIAGMGEFSIKGAGFEASAKRKQAEAAAALVAAAVSHSEADTDPETKSRGARTAAQVVAEIATPRMIRRAGRATVLWVDDRPENNVHERQALAALGVTFVLARSTDEAIDNLRLRSIDAVISDMDRPPDAQAGYTLLDRLRAGGNQTPVIIYAGSRSPKDRTEAIRRGAVGCTNRPDELFVMALSALVRGQEAKHAN